jgi:plastocyanin
MIGLGRRRRPRWGTLAAVALALAGAGCATTGSVTGRVDTPDKKKTSDSSKAQRSEPAKALLQVVDGQFVPSVLLVDPGTVVRIENRDRVYHNAFSVASIAPFDLGAIAPGKSATVRLPKAGVVKVFCEYHPKELATIVVSPAHTRNRPTTDGTSQLGGLPAESSKVSAWHPAYGTRTKLVAITGNERVTVNFRD